MKRSFFMTSLMLVVVLVGFSALAQAQPAKSERKSPPAQVKAKVNGVNISVDYSKPSKNGRLVFGGIVKYGQIWRTGANEATIFQLSASAKVNGELLKEGKYALFTIPGKEKWTIIFNSDAQQWGAYNYESEKDVLRFDVTPSYGNPTVEQFTIDVDAKGNVTLKWDDAVVSFKVS